MLNWFKKHFIPHKGNKHRPHILRKKNIKIITAAILLFEFIVFLLPTLTHLNWKNGMATVLPTVLADFANEERKSQNLPVLSMNDILNKAAEMKARDMAEKSYFAHTSPEGKTPWYWLEKVGYEYQYAGENLAINFSDSKDVTDAWMASPTHKANIIKNNYTEIGTGVAVGIYQGRETVFVAQVYANPLSTALKQNDVENKITKGNTKSSTIRAQKPEDLPSQISNGVLGSETQAALAINIEEKSIENTSLIKSKINLLQKVLSSPRTYTNIILYTFTGLIAFALLLKLLIRFEKKHHLDLITNGLFVLALLGAMFVTNHYMTHKDMVVSQSFDYSLENKAL